MLFFGQRYRWHNKKPQRCDLRANEYASPRPEKRTTPQRLCGAFWQQSGQAEAPHPIEATQTAEIPEQPKPTYKSPKT
jgi:hypothetical protein